MAPWKTRAKLSEAQAINIFNLKKNSPTISAARIATIYGVGEKTIRDIWTGRTWSRETRHLSAARPRLQRTAGLLKGSNSSSIPRAINGSNSFSIPRSINRLQNLSIQDSLASLADCAKTVDQQLYEWDKVFWIDNEGADPFHNDWSLWQSEPENRVESVYLPDNHGPLKFKREHI